MKLTRTYMSSFCANVLQEETQKTESASLFIGDWITDAFGKIKLEQWDKGIIGTFIEIEEGIIEGFIQGNVLNFKWKTAKNEEGWGFFRAIDDRTLVGFWGDDNDKTKVRSVIAARSIRPFALSIPKFDRQDKQDLRELGYNLVSQGKCLQALKPLEKALKLYREERSKEETWSVVKDSYLIDEYNILMRISDCYLKIYDELLDYNSLNYLYDSLIKSLIDTITIRRFLSQRDYLEKISKELASSMRTSLSSSLENWRARLARDIDKITALEKGQPFFQDLVDFLIELGNENEALVASETARARAFADLLAGKSDIQNNIQRCSPQKAELLSPRSAPPVNLKGLLETVQRNKSVTIEYFITDHNLIIWIIDTSGFIKAVTHPVIQRDLENMVTQFIGHVQSPNPSTKDLSNDLTDLYTHLIEPIPEELLPISPDEVLTIIPHKFLFRIPFGALKDSNGRYLIEKHALAYSASIEVLRYIYNNNKYVNIDKKNLLAFVNPRPLSDPRFSTLEDTERFFNQISRLYLDTPNNKILTGENATKHVLKRDATRYAVLHFATHAEASENDPTESFIALARDSLDDGCLRINDIFGLSLQADLVILAACETGVGKITGDGVIGLGRAFIWAGTATLLISLWQVPELQSLDLMYEFHLNWISEGESKACALRRAQLKQIELRNNRDRPDLWAGFILFGEWD